MELHHRHESRVGEVNMNEWRADLIPTRNTIHDEEFSLQLIYPLRTIAIWNYHRHHTETGIDRLLQILINDTISVAVGIFLVSAFATELH